MPHVEPTADQEHVVGELRRLFVDDVVTMEEYADRVGLVLAARSPSEVAQAIDGLPITSSATTSTTAPAARHAHQSAPSPSTMIAVFGGSRHVGRWRAPSHLRAFGLFGGTTIDLREASTDQPEITITAIALFGSVDVIVPEGVDIDLTGMSLFGGRRLDVADVSVLPGLPSVHVRAFVLFGGVTVASKRRGPDRGRSGRFGET
jgi:Cell wall-active antibiotics response 4TMS YvqF